VHGALFVIYLASGAVLAGRLGWSAKKLLLACVISSLPFGPFIFDRMLFPAEN
jgi:integral membrane protein